MNARAAGSDEQDAAPTVYGTSVVELAAVAGIVFQMFCSSDGLGT